MVHIDMSGCALLSKFQISFHLNAKFHLGRIQWNASACYSSTKALVTLVEGNNVIRLISQ